jgi:hypothetical protein
MRGIYQKELDKLDKSPDNAKGFLREKRSVSRGDSMDESAGKKTTFRR